MSWIFSAVLVVIPSIILSLFALWLVRKFVPAVSLRKHHDVAGFTFSIVGVLYSVILGFTVVNVQERYNQAAETIHTEATMVADLYRDADFFPNASRIPIRQALRQYVQYVIKEEWTSHKDTRFNSDIILKNLWQSYRVIDIEDERTKIWYTAAIGKLDLLMNARLSRALYSWEHLSSMMWTVLLSGAVITICFMFFFGLENMRTQMLMTAILAGYLSFMLYLVFSLDHVFKGSQRIQPTALEQTLVQFDQMDQKN